MRHSSDDIDFTAMRGKVVAIVGFSASAVDSRRSLGSGRAEGPLLVRAPDVRINKMNTQFSGIYRRVFDAAGEARLDLLSYVMRYRTAPPRDSVTGFSTSQCRDQFKRAPGEGHPVSGSLEISAGAYRFTADEIICARALK